jgi:hypothetical protein
VFCDFWDALGVFNALCMGPLLLYTAFLVGYKRHCFSTGLAREDLYFWLLNSSRICSSSDSLGYNSFGTG